MKDNTLLFEVKGQYIVRLDSIEPVAKCRNLYKAQFQFKTDEWTGTKTALFVQGKHSKSVILDENGVCEIPWEFFDSDNTTFGYVSVYCGDLVTANRVVVDIVKSGYQESDASVPPSPDVYQQLIELAEDTKKIAQSVRDDADAGKFDGEEGYSPKVLLTEELDGVTVTVQNKDVQQSAKVKNGKDGKPGKNGDPGADGITPHIGENGNWHIGDTDTGKPSRGLRGENATDKQVRTAVDAYMEENPVAITVDPTLAQEGQAADAKATGDKILQFTIKNTASGESIVLTDGAEEKLLDFGMQGKTEQLTTEGKNLFDIDEFLKLPLEQFSNYGNARVLIITLKPNTAYTMHTDNTGSLTGEVDVSRSLYFTSVDDMMLDGNTTGVFKGHNITKTSDETGKLKIVLIDRKNAIPIVNKEKYVMLAEGSTALPYEPYTGGKPSPSQAYPQGIVSAAENGEIEVQVTGKNLFTYSNDFSNWKKYVNDSYFGSVTSDKRGITSEALKSYAIIKSPTFKLKPNTAYTISAMIDTIDKSTNIGVRIFKNLNVSDYLKTIAIARRKNTNKLQKVSTTFTTDDLKDTNEVYIQLDCSWSDTVLPTIVTFSDIQIEIGNKLTDYETYRNQKVQLPLDRPLTKWDRIEKRDGVYGIAYSSKHVIFNGEETWVKSSVNNSFHLKGFEGLSKSYEIFCDKLKSYRGSVNEIAQNVILGNTTNLYVNIDGITDVETLRTWLSENNLDVYYFSKESEFVPLQQETQTALNNLHTYYPTTVMSNSEDCEMEVTYVCDTKTYIDNKFKELQQATISTNLEMLERRYEVIL